MGTLTPKDGSGGWGVSIDLSTIPARVIEDDGRHGRADDGPQVEAGPATRLRLLPGGLLPGDDGILHGDPVPSDPGAPMDEPTPGVLEPSVQLDPELGEPLAQVLRPRRGPGRP